MFRRGVESFQHGLGRYFVVSVRIKHWRHTSDAGDGSWASMVVRLEPGVDLIHRDLLERLRYADHAVYEFVAESSTETLDVPLRRLSEAANYSRLWLTIASVMYAFGGSEARRAIPSGVVAIAATSFLVNVVIKSKFGRARPDRNPDLVPDKRKVPMPESTSFPSGHSASAFAFATAVGHQLPTVALPLRVLAAAVAYSRVHSGVHYPADAIGGSIIGIAMGHIAARISRFRSLDMTSSDSPKPADDLACQA